jgi:ankyrin repeat protein
MSGSMMGSASSLVDAMKANGGSAPVTHSSQMSNAQMWLNREQYQSLRDKEIKEAEAAVVRENWALVNRADSNQEKYLIAATRGKAYVENYINGDEEKGIEGVDVNSTGVADNNALHKAAENGHEPIVDRLLRCGVEIDALNQFGKTALHKACFYKRIGVIRTLLEAGADPDIVDTSDGWTALHRASRYGHDFVVRLLLMYGADPDMRTVKCSKRTTQGLVDKDELFTPMELAKQGAHACVQDLLLNTDLHGKEKREWFG